MYLTDYFIVLPVGFGSLMDIDKFVRGKGWKHNCAGFGSLMDIDKFVQDIYRNAVQECFGSLMDIDKFVLYVSKR